MYIFFYVFNIDVSSYIRERISVRDRIEIPNQNGLKTRRIFILVYHEDIHTHTTETRWVIKTLRRYNNPHR